MESKQYKDEINRVVKGINDNIVLLCLKSSPKKTNLLWLIFRDFETLPKNANIYNSIQVEETVYNELIS